MADEKATTEAKKPTGPVSTTKKPVLVTCGINLPFAVKGSGFGSVRGKLLIGGKDVPTMSWRDDKIKGYLPRDIDISADITVIPG